MEDTNHHRATTATATTPNGGSSSSSSTDIDDIILLNIEQSRAQIIQMFDPLYSNNTTGTNTNDEFDDTDKSPPPSLISTPVEGGVLYPSVEYALEKVSERLKDQESVKKVFKNLSKKTIVLDEGFSLKSSIFFQDCMECHIVVKHKVNNISLESCQNMRIVFPSLVNKLELFKCINIRGFCITLPSTTQIEACDSVCVACASVDYNSRYQAHCVYSSRIFVKIHLLMYSNTIRLNTGLEPSVQFSTYIYISPAETCNRPYTIKVSKVRNEVEDIFGKGSVTSWMLNQ
jgi:hypothetical protein